MARYKHNQLVEAIARTLDARNRRADELALRLKRLLMTDRRLVRGERSRTEASNRYAFHAEGPPGSGIEVMFSGFEAFALLAAVLLLEHGIPQAAVVHIMRQIRTDLEAAHRDTLKKDPQKLFDPKAIRTLAEPGMIATDNTDPVFLAIIKFSQPATAGKVRALISVCRGNRELAAFIKKHSAPGYGTTFFELVSKMHKLAANLLLTCPKNRGRSRL